MKKHIERLYLLNPGAYCGLYMPEHVMKRLAKLNAKHTDEVRRILTDHKSEIYARHWTLANEYDGEKIKTQLIIQFTKADEGVEDVEQRIALFKAESPEYQPDVYIVNDYDEAREVAQALLDAEIKERDETR